VLVSIKDQSVWLGIMAIKINFH